MGRVMIVVVGVDELAAVEKLADVAGPDLGFALAVHDDFVPRLRLRFDSLPVADSTDVSEIGSERFQLFGELRDRPTSRPDRPGRARQKRARSRSKSG